ncbi:hypothetical protein OUZ56_002479 [Daphnia magna]|uniref:Uncharacterized protein n=1 Tax=Daphnia magna TaxID=35525 RepID=A0ABR0A5V3_9CRUS|nr:hypothetical protein OUZ56_002479 [Daphnia magna]
MELGKRTLEDWKHWILSSCYLLVIPESRRVQRGDNKSVRSVLNILLATDNVFISLGAVPICSSQSYSVKNRLLKKSAYCADLHNAGFIFVKQMRLIPNLQLPRLTPIHKAMGYLSQSHVFRIKTFLKNELYF